MRRYAFWIISHQKIQLRQTAKFKSLWFCLSLRRWLFHLQKPPFLTYALQKTIGFLIWNASSIFPSLLTPTLCIECQKASASTSLRTESAVLPCSSPAFLHQSVMKSRHTPVTIVCASKSVSHISVTTPKMQTAHTPSSWKSTMNPLPLWNLNWWLPTVNLPSSSTRVGWTRHHKPTPSSTIHCLTKRQKKYRKSTHKSAFFYGLFWFLLMWWRKKLI